jgi:hypothetical protein
VTFTETFTGSDGAAWPSGNWTTAYNTGTGSSATIQSNQGRMVTGTSGSFATVLAVKGNESAVDSEFYGEFIYAGNAYASITLRGGHSSSAVNNGYQLRIPQGVSFQLYRADTGASLADVSGSFSTGTTYKVRFQVIGTAIKAKYWTGASEPGTWNIEVTNSAISSSGPAILDVVRTSVNTNIQWDNITFSNLDAPVAKTDSTPETLAFAETENAPVQKLEAIDSAPEPLGFAETEAAIEIANDVNGAGIHANNIPVTAGTTYTASLYARVSLENTLRLELIWQDSGGATISSNNGADISVSANTWTRLSASAAAPSGAVKLRVRVEVGTSGDPFYTGQILDADALFVTTGADLWNFTTVPTQRLEVVRSVDEVVRSHDVGAQIKLANPWHWLARPVGGEDYQIPTRPIPPPPDEGGGGGGGGDGTHPNTVEITTGGGGGGGGGSSPYRSTLPWALGCFGNGLGSSASGKVDAFSAMAGVLLDFVDQHPDWGAIGEANSWWIEPHVGRGYNMCVSVPLYSGSPTTNVDSMWSAAATNLRNAGWDKPYWRIGVEYNLNNSWRATDSNASDWIAAYQRAVNAIRAVSPDSRFILCMNEGNPQSCSSSTSDNIVNTLCASGHVDMIGPDYYDQWEPIRTTSEATSRFGTTSTHGTMNYWLGRARSLGTKFAIPEWGVASGTQWSGHAGGDNPFYMNYLMDWLYANRDTVEQVCYFEEPDPYLRSDITTTSTNPQARSAFQSKVSQFKGTAPTPGGGGGTTYTFPLSGQDPLEPTGWGGSTSSPGGRGTDQLVTYSSVTGTTTETDQYGMEITVNASGSITALNDRQPDEDLAGTAIPTAGNGYVLSGAGTARDFLLQRAVIGATVALTGSSTDPPPPPPPPPAGTWPLKVAGNGYFLEYQNGTPFLYCADTAWVTLSRLTVADAKRYIDIKKSQGFSVIQSSLTVWYRGNAGDRGSPFSGADLTSPNASYWAGIDELLNYLQTNGMLAVLWPIWGADNGSWAGGSSPSTSDMATYCTWLGTRYKNQGNVMWALGGDEQYNGDSEATARTGFWDAAAAALEAADPAHLKTYHPRWDNFNLNGASWLDFNSIQHNDNNPPMTYELARDGTEDYNKPFLNSEPPYYPSNPGGVNTTRQRNRFNGWGQILGGGLGVVYGGSRYGTWNIGADGQYAWADTQHVTGNDIGNIKRILSEFHWERLVPNWDSSVITSSRGSYGSTSYVTCGKASDNSLIVCYLPAGGSVTIQKSNLSASGTAYWYDPTTGAISGSGSAITNSGTQVFTTPGNNDAGENDWCLVLATSTGEV